MALRKINIYAMSFSSTLYQSYACNSWVLEAKSTFHVIMNPEISSSILASITFYTRKLWHEAIKLFFPLEVLEKSRARLKMKPDYLCSINQSTIFLHLESWAMR